MRQVYFIINLILISSLVILSLTIIPIQARAETTAEIIVDPTEGLITDENGGTASFTVQLDSQPSDHVTLNLSSSDSGEGLVPT